MIVVFCRDEKRMLVMVVGFVCVCVGGLRMWGMWGMTDVVYDDA